MEYIKYIVLIVILVLIALAISKSRKKDFKVEVNKLIEYLGGKDNILTTEYNKSRFIVTLKDISLANKEAINKMEGAKGVLEVDNQLKIVLDNDAKQLEKYINDIK